MCVERRAIVIDVVFICIFDVHQCGNSINFYILNDKHVRHGQREAMDKCKRNY